MKKFMLTEDNFMVKLQLRKQGFTYSACITFTTHHKMIQKFREPGDLKHIYKIELDKTWFAHNAGYSNSKGLAQRTISDKLMKFL